METTTYETGADASRWITNLAPTDVQIADIVDTIDYHGPTWAQTEDYDRGLLPADASPEFLAAVRQQLS